jgi:uncharacterized protein YoxC
MGDKKQEAEDINEQFADIAEAILKVAQLGEAVQKSPLSKDAVVTLIHRKLGSNSPSRTDIENVLWAIPRLQDYLK